MDDAPPSCASVAAVAAARNWRKGERRAADALRQVGCESPLVDVKAALERAVELMRMFGRPGVGGGAWEER